MTARERGQSWCWLLLLAAWSCACGDSHTDGDRNPSVNPADAGDQPAQRDAAGIADAADQADPADDPAPDDPNAPPPPPPSRALTDEEAKWAAATDFEIGISGTACFGSCPTYSMMVGATGDLRFTGRQYTWKPGTYEVQIPADTVAKLYSNLILRGFLGLQARYRTQEDGCDEVWTDNPSNTFRLRAAGLEKTIEYYHGCRGASPVFATLRAIEREIVQMTNLKPFLTNTREDCGSRAIEYGVKLEPSYVLFDPQKKSVGILRFDPAVPTYRQSWVVATCDGQELASADRTWSADCGPVLAAATESMLTWPGMDSPQSAVGLYLAAGEPAKTAKKIDLRLFTFDVDSTQHAEPGDRCR
jgi:hypothetical protein